MNELSKYTEDIIHTQLVCYSHTFYLHFCKGNLR